VVVIPGGNNPPRDLNNDGKIEDVNGNGRKDFADITLYFSQMTWIGANEPLSAFDYNGNGRIDFADVTWLFQHL
jgi:PKD repeat protein